MEKLRRTSKIKKKTKYPPETEKEVIIGYIDKIRKKMPIWKQGGKEDNTVQFLKVGRKKTCPCGIFKPVKQRQFKESMI